MTKQTDLILLHMKKFGSITHLEAESEYGIARLASRIIGNFQFYEFFGEDIRMKKADIL